jgi:uncharacterized protein (UPF0332 family)
VKKGKLSEATVNMLDALRIERHETLYGLDAESNLKVAEYALEKAKEFLKTVKEFIRR